MGVPLLPALAIGQLALSGVGAFAQSRAASAQAQAQAEASRANAQLQYAELTRQQRDVARERRENQADIIRQANQELGTLRAVASEVGASPSSFMRAVSEIGGIEGLNIGRLVTDARSRTSALQAEKTAYHQQYTNTVTQAYNQASVARQGALFGFVGSGLQIAGNAYGAYTQMQANQEIQGALETARRMDVETDLELRRNRR